VCCVSASGSYVTPVLIFKRAREKDEMKDGAPLGTMFALNSISACITKEFFLVWTTDFLIQ
jgi:hypothetical protein